MKKGFSAFLCWLLTVAMVLSLTACGDLGLTDDGDSGAESGSEAAASQAAFQALTEKLFQDSVTSDLITLHYTLKAPEAYGITEYACTFGDFSLKAMTESLEKDEKLLANMKSISYKHLTEDQKRTYDVLLWTLEDDSFYADLFLYEEPLGLVNGVHTTLPITLSEYQFHDRQDVEDYLALLQTADDYFTQIMAFEQQKSDAGLFMSDKVAAQVLEACRTFRENPSESYLISTFDERVDALTELTGDEKTAYKAQNQKHLLEDFFPAYDILIEGLEALLGTGKNDTGLCALPLGKAYARTLLTAYTGTERSPEDYEELLADYVNDAFSTMAELLRQYPALAEEAGNFSFSLSDPEQILNDLQQKMTEDFPALPTEAVYTIKYVPAALEESTSPAFYMVPSIDTYRDNVIYINRSSTRADSLYSTLAHEGYPGHLYQNVYSRCTVVDPVRAVLNFPGYSEGWASYVESQSYFWDTSLSEPLQELMSLNNDASLLLYALLDLYINYFGYDSEDTGAFLENYFGVTDEAVVEEIYYYMVGDPLNYLKYAGGYVEFSELRKLAEEALGSRFVTKDFHQFLLESGEAPFPVLENWLKEWIQGIEKTEK